MEQADAAEVPVDGSVERMDAKSARLGRSSRRSHVQWREYPKVTSGRDGEAINT